MHGREGLRADGTLRKALNDAEAFMTLRFKLPPGGDVPPITAARRMGLSLDAFRDALPELVARGFPQANDRQFRSRCHRRLAPYSQSASFSRQLGP